MSGAPREQFPFIRYTELLALTLVFLTVLALLYPKDTLKRQVLAERSNYDLTARYLKNLLRLEPSNEALMMGLARNAINSGQDELALRLLTVLEQRRDPRFLPQVLQLRYRILERQLPHLPAEKQAPTRREMERLLKRIDGLAPRKLEPRRYWFRQFLSHGMYGKARELIREALQDRPDSLFWIREALQLSLKEKRFAEAERYLRRLQALDGAHRERWLEQAYYLAVARKDFPQAHAYLKQLEHYSRKWTREKARLALQEGDYLQASLIYRRLAEKASDPQKRKEWLLKALSALQQGSLLDQAVALARAHENEYLNDPKMIQYFLKLYLAAGKLDAAAALSKHLLERSTTP